MAAITTTTETVWMPPLATGHHANIYAAVVTAAPSATEYRLACEQSFATPYPAECAELESWTLTYGPSVMRLDMGSETLVCERGDEDALCTVHVAGSPEMEGVSITSVAGVESASWYTAVTVVPRPDQDDDQDDDFESDDEDEAEDEVEEADDKDWNWAELLKKRDASPTTTSGKCRATNSKVKREPKKGSSSGGSGRSGRGGSNKGKGPGRGSRRKGAGAASNKNNDDDCDNAAAGGAVANLKLTGVLVGAAVGFVLFGL